MKIKPKQILIPFISGIVIAFLDYIIWVYYSTSDVIDAVVIGILGALISFFGIKWSKK